MAAHDFSAGKQEQGSYTTAGQIRQYPVVCVTGPMAAGKNLATSILEECGFAVIDADQLVHAVVEELKPAILARFSETAKAAGFSLLQPDGRIDRRALGRIVFSDSSALRIHEALIHPEIDRQLISFIEAHQDRPVALNATVLYKTPVLKRCSCIIFIDAPWIFRFFRAKQRDHLPICQIFARFRSQKDIFAQYQKSGADIYRVRNIGTQKQLEKKLLVILDSCHEKG